MSDFNFRPGMRVRFLPREQQRDCDSIDHRCEPGRIVMLGHQTAGSRLLTADIPDKALLVFDPSSVELVPVKLEHNELFDVDTDTPDINTAEYIDFRRYVELVPGVSSLCITITRNLFENSQFIELTHEVDGNHSTLMSESLDYDLFVELTGFKLVDDIPQSSDVVAPIPSSNIIDRGSYYE